jgi:diadenosine tetraphosphate (Ap4A) HIT family hydrolase
VTDVVNRGIAAGEGINTAPACDLCALLATEVEVEAEAESKPEPGAVLWRGAALSVVQVDDAAYPGFCRVVWHQHVKEMTDLSEAERSDMMRAVWQVELAVRDTMAPDKVNLASLGNMTPHLHWHVIPRFGDDAQFPDPLWAAARRTTAPETLAARRALLPQLRAAIAKRMASLTNESLTKE